MNGALAVEARMLRLYLAHKIAEKFDLPHGFEIDKPGAQRIVDIVRVVGDVVCQSSRLRLGAGVAP